MKLGPYILEECVGKGAMAEVWSGWHADRDERVAVKVLSRLVGREDSELDAFFHELRTVASLSHPGIVQILDYGHGYFEPHGRQVPYMVTELAHGGTLGTGWRAGTFADVRRTLQAILDALAHAHARGVIHRDLKPGNVLRAASTPDAELKVADFGIARLAPIGERSYADGLIAGTPKYMAPEQVRGEWRDHGPWTDLYAVGCIAWTMVTGRPPFEGDRDEVYAQHLNAEPPELEPILSVPHEFEDWMRWLLRKDISRRCDRAADASMELMAIQMPDNPQTIEVSMFLDEPSTSSLFSNELHGSSLDRPAPERVSRLRRLASANHALSRTSIHHELRLWGLRRVPFVGRRAQRTQLWDALQEAFESPGPQLAVLDGPAGTGKSSLARWLVERSHELGLANPILILHDTVSRRNDGIRGALTRTFRLEDLPIAEAVARIRMDLTNDLSESDALTAAGVIGEWVASSSDDPVSSFEADERAQALLAVLRAHGKRRVPLVWIEDIDRAADAVRTLTQALMLAGDDPVRLVVVATRGDRGPRVDDALKQLSEHCSTRTVHLHELTQDEARDLLDAMLPLTPDFRDAVIKQTAGNPLFAVQMLGALISRNELHPNDDGEFAPRDLSVSASTFSGLLQLRIGALAAQFEVPQSQVQAQLELAATLGRVVRRVEWLVVCGSLGVTPDAALVDALVRTGLAVPSGDHWAFVHELVRDELIASAKSRGRFARWNLICAEMLDDLYASADPERCAKHLLNGGSWSEALDACIRAAESTWRSNAPERARRWLDRAEVALLRTNAPDDDIRRGAVKALRERVA